jgi:hypothetical protein
MQDEDVSTKQAGQSGEASDLYSESARFEPHQEHRVT